MNYSSRCRELKTKSSANFLHLVKVKLCVRISNAFKLCCRSSVSKTRRSGRATSCWRLKWRWRTNTRRTSSCCSTALLPLPSTWSTRRASTGATRVNTVTQRFYLGARCRRHGGKGTTELWKLSGGWEVFLRVFRPNRSTLFTFFF